MRNRPSPRTVPTSRDTPCGGGRVGRVRITVTSPSSSRGQPRTRSRGQTRTPSRGQTTTPSRGQPRTPSHGQTRTPSRGQTRSPSRGQSRTLSQRPQTCARSRSDGTRSSHPRAERSHSRSRAVPVPRLTPAQVDFYRSKFRPLLDMELARLPAAPAMSDSDAVKLRQIGINTVGDAISILCQIFA